MNDKTYSIRWAVRKLRYVALMCHDPYYWRMAQRWERQYLNGPDLPPQSPQQTEAP